MSSYKLFGYFLGPPGRTILFFCFFFLVMVALMHRCYNFDAAVGDDAGDDDMRSMPRTGMRMMTKRWSRRRQRRIADGDCGAVAAIHAGREVVMVVVMMMMTMKMKIILRMMMKTMMLMATLWVWMVPEKRG